MSRLSEPKPGVDYWPDGYAPEARRWWAAGPLPLGLQIVLFCGIYLLLQSQWKSVFGGVLEHWVVARGTVEPAALWVRLLTPELQPFAASFSLRAGSGGPGIHVLNGCEGLDVLFLLWAALAVSGLSWRWWLTGFLVGTPLVWLLNQVRVVALFYANRADKDLFALLHGTVAPLLLIACTLIAFLALMRAGLRPDGQPGLTEPPAKAPL